MFDFDIIQEGFLFKLDILVSVILNMKDYKNILQYPFPVSIV